MKNLSTIDVLQIINLKRSKIIGLFLCIFLFSHCSKDKDDEFPEISACKWLNDSPCFLNLSFDDAQDGHLEIAKLLDEYGYKGTFYINSGEFNTNLIDKYKYIIHSGHEVGNHTASHVNLTNLNEKEVIDEINSCSTILNLYLNINCTSFAHPYHQSNTLVNNIIFNQNLYTRNWSEYHTSERPRYNLTSTSEINNMIKFIDNQIANNSSCIICGHGFDNNGFSPCTDKFSIELLEYIRKVQNDKKVWVTTMSNGALYESLYNEVNLTSYMDKSNYQIKIQVDFPEKIIYNNFNKLLYSLKIGKSSSWSIQNKGIEYIESDTHYIYTIDLKQTKELILKYNIN